MTPLTLKPPRKQPCFHPGTCTCKPHGKCWRRWDDYLDWYEFIGWLRSAESPTADSDAKFLGLI